MSYKLHYAELQLQGDIPCIEFVGFHVGCLHYQKGFVGDCKITYAMDGW